MAEVESLEFKWGKKRGIGGKKRDVQFYESFIYDGAEYALYDSVYLYKEDEPEPYIGKLIKIWENADKTKKVKVLWFFRPSEISNFLGNYQTLENELFLACGEGVGLVNVNPLEAIAGKCNIICTSKDARNRQPSDVELQTSEFVFYRTFDVGLREVLDKIEEKIAGIEVKFLLNREVPVKVHLNRKDVGTNPTTSYKSPISGQQDIPKIITAKQEGGVPAQKEKEYKEVPLMEQKSSLKQKSISSVGGDLGELTSAIDKQKHMSSYNTGLPVIVEENGEYEKSKAKSGKILGSREELKSSRGPGELDNRPFKKAKFDSSVKVHDDKRVPNSSGHGAKLTSSPDNGKDNSRTKQAVVKHSHGIDDGLFRKPKLDKELVKSNSGKLAKVSSIQPSSVKNSSNNQVVDVTRQPDRSKWFKELPWEDRIRAAHEQGKLVLLENLDPCYTSIEVEDIVWDAFKEKCSTKMIQQIAFSSPHSGQAYVIFKTKEAAEMVITKLDEGCLLLSNGRPLVGSFRTPCFGGKQSAFVGHLVIDKHKIQMLREMREAMSTSHCSQPNTLEYEMAIEWALQQERQERAWKMLYEQQELELKRLEAKFKTK